LSAAMWVIAALTFVSGTVSATRMAETLHASGPYTPPSTRTGRTNGYAQNAGRME